MQRFRRSVGTSVSTVVISAALVGLLGSCTSTSTTSTPTLPVAPFCNIVIGESLENGNLREVMVTRRTDPATANHFTRASGIGGPKGNPTLGSNNDVYAIREAWLHRPGAPVVVRSEAHPANRRNTTDALASSWLIREQDATGAWSGPYAGGSGNRGDEVDSPAAGALTVPQLMTVGVANLQMFACVGGRTQDNTARTTWLIEITSAMPATPTTANTPASVMTIQDVINGDDRFLPNAPGPLIGPANPPTPRVRGPGDQASNGNVQCAMTQVGDDVTTRELHMIAIRNGVLYHSMASNFSTATSESGSTFLRFSTISPWGDVTAVLGGGFGPVVSAAVVASRSNAISVLFVAQKGTQYRPFHAVRFSSGGGSWRPVDDMLALRDGAGAIGTMQPFKIAAGMCPAFNASTPQQDNQIVYVQWRDNDFAIVGDIVSTPQNWPGGLQGIYSPTSTLPGVMRNFAPTRNHTLLDFSISARPFP
ncbi:MAG: hypothetical protein ABW110_05615 [Steroidobacteraceae bacterium]